jgi:hypothetical protein
VTVKASNAFELSPDLVERFEAMAEVPDANGCREWAGGYSENATKRTGQPRLTFCGTPLSARRVAFAIQCGQVPDPQVYIANSCRNTRCVAPGHTEVAKSRPWVRPGAGEATASNGTGRAVTAKPAAPAPTSDFAAIVERFESVTAADAAQLDAMISAARRRIEFLEFLRGRAAPPPAPPVPPEPKSASVVAKNPPAKPKVKPAPTPRVAPVPPVTPNQPPKTETRSAGDFIDVCVRAARHIERAGDSVPLSTLAAMFGRSERDMANLLNGLGGWFTREASGLIGLTDRGRLAAREE